MLTKIRPGGILEKTISGLGTLGKGLGKQAIKTPEELAKTAVAQISPLESTEKLDEGETEKEKNKQALKATKIAQAENKPTVEVGLKEQLIGVPRDENTVDFLKQLYAPSETKDQRPKIKTTNENPLETAGILPTADPNANKSPEEQQKILKTKQELQQVHKESYYDPIFNRRSPARPEETQKEQETAAQRKERMQQEDLQKKKKDEEKKKPIAVVQAANKTESRPGAG